MNLYKLL